MRVERRGSRRLPIALSLALSVAASPAFGSEPDLLVELSPGAARPGDAVLVTVRPAHRPPHAPEKSAAPTGVLGDQALTFHAWRGIHQAVVGLPVELSAGALALRVSLQGTDGRPLVMEGFLNVLPAEFPTRELTVAGKFIKPPPKVRRRIAEDRAAFAKALAQVDRPRLFDADFAWPRPPVVTAPFGDLRTFNGAKQSQHYGVDLDGAVGEAVLAANDGVVVLVRDAYASGTTVLVFHGAGIYSAYFHLSRADVKSGATVKRGQKIGQVGATGRVTGPHLHWGMKVKDLWVDPLSVLRLRFAPAPRRAD